MSESGNDAGMRDFAQISASGGWEYQQMKYVLNYVRSIWQGLSLMFFGFILGQSYPLSFGILSVFTGVWLVSMVLDFYLYLTSREPSEPYKQYLKDKKESEARGPR